MSMQKIAEEEDSELTSMLSYLFALMLLAQSPTAFSLRCNGRYKSK